MPAWLIAAVPLLFSIAMIGIGVLVWGAWRMAFRQGNKPKAVLMLIAAAVLLGNVLIWAV